MQLEIWGIDPVRCTTIMENAIATYDGELEVSGRELSAWEEDIRALEQAYGEVTIAEIVEAREYEEEPEEKAEEVEDGAVSVSEGSECCLSELYCG
jgi:hypothetical protein